MQHTGEQILLRTFPFRTSAGILLLIVVLVCFGFGLFLPFLEVKKFWIFNNTVSLYNSFILLWQSHNYFLLVLVVGFCVIIPSLKFLLIIYVSIFATLSKAIKFLEAVEKIGKWSMLDVFVVAIMVVTVKLGDIITVEIHAGVFLFSISIILTALLVHYFLLLCKLAQARQIQIVDE